MVSFMPRPVYPKEEVHKIPAPVQCTVQVCELAMSNLRLPPYRSRQIICLSHSESVRLPLQLPMRLAPHQLHAGPGSSIPCTRARHSSTHHRTLYAVHGLCTSALKDMRLSGPQNRFGLGGKEKNLCPYWEPKPSYPVAEPIT
jgi:hypothetical protein